MVENGTGMLPLPYPTRDCLETPVEFLSGYAMRSLPRDYNLLRNKELPFATRATIFLGS